MFKALKISSKKKDVHKARRGLQVRATRPLEKVLFCGFPYSERKSQEAWSDDIRTDGHSWLTETSLREVCRHPVYLYLYI